MAGGARREVRAGWLAAVLVCAADFSIEVYAVKMDWWRLHGVWPVEGVPLVYPAGWVFIIFSYLMAYAALRRRIHWLAVIFPTFILGAGAGFLWNYLGSAHLGTMSFSKATLGDVLWVWFPLTALGLGAFQALTHGGKRNG